MLRHYRGPEWISSSMKDRWGTGFSWENMALFDFQGNTLPAMAFMHFPYRFSRILNKNFFSFM